LQKTQLEEAMTRSARIAAGLAGGLVLALSACGDGRISDASISESISNRLNAEQELAAYDIDVDTEDGIVTLDGSVAVAEHRSEAERIARSTAGVQGVSNQIEVGSEMAPDVAAPGAPTPRDPAGQMPRDPGVE
jgi:hypothetical protein